MRGLRASSDVGADAEALGDAGAERLDEGVGLLDQAQQDLDARRAT